MSRPLEHKPTAVLVTGFILGNLAFKGALISLNAAEYTDGILQLTLLRRLNSIYPPLYALAAGAVNLAIGDLELAGRVVSVLASSLSVWPLFLLAERLFGRRAAVYAALFYTVSPIPLRWALHAMTDATFGALFLTAIWLYTLAWVRYGEEATGAAGPDAAGSGDRSTAAGGGTPAPSAPRTAPPAPSTPAVWAIVCSVLATLTRYQGALLFPLGFFFLNYDWHRRRRLPVALNLAHVLWVLPVGWAAVAGFVHGRQFAERTAPSLGATLLNYWFHFESWLTYMPFFFTPLLGALMLGGVFLVPRGRTGAAFYTIAALGLTAAVVVLQTLFSSFQSRYLLPVVLLLMPFAGHAASTLEDRAQGRPAARRLHSALMTAALLWALGFAITAVSLQRSAFGDLKAACRFVAARNPRGTVFVNETYRDDLHAVKASFWLGREARYLDPALLENGLEFKDGDYIIWSSAYGGTDHYQAFMTWLMHTWNFFPAREFTSVIVPVLPDIMEFPGMSQNPIALSYRYYPQEFFTVVFARRPEGQTGPLQPPEE
ncbi:MAG: hypothetical protein Kow0059_16650 [Candidatus Sumerlaeia bacterium]